MPDFQEKMRNLSAIALSKWKKIKKQIWPIRWQYFRQPSDLLLAFSGSPRYLQLSLCLVSVSLLVSIYFLFFGSYLAFTKEVPASGGDLHEAVLGMEIRRFNPVLEPSSEAERKVTSLLFQPLYRVEFPDFLSSKDNPTIKPVLLAKAPEWTDLSNQEPENRYKTLKFTLKNNIYWSNNNPITMADILYTFERLKDENANSLFKEVFRDVEITRLTETEFTLINSKGNNPQLLYLANFTPISKDFFGDSKNNELIGDPKSVRPRVVSGFFTLPEMVKDPFNPRASDKVNPIRSSNDQRVDSVVLQKNPVQNSSQVPLIDRYILINYESLSDTGGQVKSLQRSSKEGLIDIYSRFLTPSSQTVSSSEVKEKLGLEQQIVPTNTFYSVYLNIERSTVGYFINSYLRRYLVCSLLNFKASSNNAQLRPIPRNRQLLPINFGQSAEPDCPTSTADLEKILEEAKTAEGKPIYTFTGEGAARRLQVLGEPIELKMITLLEMEGQILKQFQEFMGKLGFSLVITNDSETVNSNLQAPNKPYNLALLPITLVGKDMYPLFGVDSRNVLQVDKNNREPIPSYKFEENLKKYSQSNSTDTDAKQKLTDFFSKEHVMVNLFATNQEINHSTRVNGLEFSNMDIYNFPEDLYQKIPQWYVKTKRQ